MAQRVNVILVDDIDGEQADESLTFGLDGITYEIDLSEVHAKELRAAMDPFVNAARRVGGRKRTTSRAGAASAPSTGVDVGDAKPAEIRAWAIASGYELPARGRIPEDVRQAYMDAS